jgi:hypothetical protein
MSNWILFLKKAALRPYTKWCLMLVILFWLLVYRLSEQSVHLPQFVYVNF